MIWTKAGDIYFNGSHSDYKTLSLYHRPHDRNNQALEGSHNAAIAIGESDAAHSSRGSFQRWLNTAKKEEFAFATREYQLHHLNSTVSAH